MCRTVRYRVQKPALREGRGLDMHTLCSMPTPIIGLTTYPADLENKLHARVEYVEAIRRAGGIPLLIPPGDPRAVEILDHLDGLLLSGGGDIDPRLYGGQIGRAHV